MSRRIVLTLTDDEYAALQARADAERRTPKQMAEYLVTRQSFTFTQPIGVPIGPTVPNLWPPNVWTGSIETAPDLKTYTTWSSPNQCANGYTLAAGTPGHHV